MSLLLGVRIQWEATSYTYSENIGTVQLVLLKEGSAVSDVLVEVTTVVGSASGMSYRTSFEICNNLF